MHRARFTAYAVLSLLLCSPALATWTLDPPPPLCQPAYQLALDSVHRVLTAAELQVVSDCTDASLAHYILGTVQGSTSAQQSLPMPSNRVRGPLEVAFEDALLLSGGGLTVADESQLLSLHRAAAALVLLTIHQGEISSAVESWLVQEGANVIDRLVLCVHYCEPIRCSAVGAGQGAHRRVLALAQQGCGLNQVFDFLTPGEINAAVALAHTGGDALQRGYAQNVAYALERSGDSRYLSLPPLQGSLADVVYVYPTSAGVRHPDFTISARLLHAYGRMPALLY